MKSTYILSTMLFAFLLIISGCKDENPEPDELTIQLNALMNDGSSWSLASEGVIKDGYDVTDQFIGFNLTIGNKTFTTQNSLSAVWASNGTWDFKGSNPNIIVRTDGTEISFSLNGKNLVLTFMGNGTNGGRKEAVSGEYTFHLNGN